MKKLAIASAVALTAVGAHADWLLNEYATAAADSAAVNKAYGIQSFANTSSVVGLSVTPGSFTFKATFKSDGTKGYTANVGVLHPLTPDWAETDLTSLKQITFEFKNNVKISDVLAVSFGSGTYDSTTAKAGTVYENTLKVSAANTAWKAASFDIADFATPSWWTAPVTFPTLNAVLKRVKNLQFAPKTLYTAAGTQDGTACTKCVGPDMTSELVLEIRKVTLVGVDEVNWPNPENVGCESKTPFTLLDAFEDGDTENELGGYWFGFSDTNSLKPTDKATGSSTWSMDITPGELGSNGYLTFGAGLNKSVGTTWHDYAGWASVGTQFAGQGVATGMDKLTAIGFSIQKSKDMTYVKAVNFKVGQVGVADTATHFAAFPTAAMKLDQPKTACVRPEDLTQASWLQASHKVAPDPTKFNQFAWELKIADQKSSAINKDSVGIIISDVKLFGNALIKSKDTSSSIRNHKSKVAGFSVATSEGALTLKGFEGFKSFEVVSIDGKSVASFAPAARVSLSLPRGTYFLVGKRDGASMTKSFVVAR